MKQSMSRVVFAACAVVILTSGPVFGETVLSDDFSSGLGNWATGTNTGINPGGPDLSVIDGEVAFRQGYDYIETLDGYSESFEISFDVRRTDGSAQNFDFLVEAVDAPWASGLLRFQYGIQDTFVINIGDAPSTTVVGDTGDGVETCDPDYRQSMNRNGQAREGRLTYTYANGAVKLAFTHDVLGTIETAWVNIGTTLSSTTIRIWAMGSNSGGLGTRMLDNVTIDAPVVGSPVFMDDFSGGFVNWTPGTNTGVNGSHDVAIVGGEVAFSQGYDYIESIASFGDSIEISFDARRTNGSNQNFDFLVELVEAPDFSGLMRFQYGLEDFFVVNVGSAPSTTSASELGDSVLTCDPDYQQRMNRNGQENAGRITYTYASGSMKFAFTHPSLGTIETPWVDTGASFVSTKIRIWAMGTGSSGDGTRLLDNVTIEAPVVEEPPIFSDGFETGTTDRWS
jgi:hypothetical protein